MSYAASISEDNNVGSIRELSLAMANWFSAFNPASLYSMYAWEDMDFLPETASVKDSSKVTANGTEYSYSLVFTFNKQNVALYQVFQKYIGERGVIRFTDNNGLTRIIGTPQKPVTITHDADTGQQYRSLNYYKISASWVNNLPAVVV
ncbi:hypothetical protein GCM10023149_30930 [Mucilaginibacter gynuensis]|uniref:Uncharacterized protein n=1 Tax=Mucilaginibacter gynuensis TaxID=1302236 RepID=A0ABP8GNF8_9SPHI